MSVDQKILQVGNNSDSPVSMIQCCWIFNSNWWLIIPYQSVL